VVNLIAIGDRILPKLKADPSLVEAYITLRASQTALEESFRVHQEALNASREAAEARKQAYRNLSDRMREFALVMLSVVRNDHEADAYVNYFPVGYGDAIHEPPETIGEAASIIIAKLALEVDGWILSFKDRLAAALDAFAAAQEAYLTAAATEHEGYSILVSARRRWVIEIYRSRLLACHARPGEKSYIRAVYAPALRRRRTSGHGASESAGQRSAAAAAEAPVPAEGTVPPPETMVDPMHGRSHAAAGCAPRPGPVRIDPIRMNRLAGPALRDVHSGRLKGQSSCAACFWAWGFFPSRHLSL
jgi:hypothetical protein